MTGTVNEQYVLYMCIPNFSRIDVVDVWERSCAERGNCLVGFSSPPR